MTLLPQGTVQRCWASDFLSRPSVRLRTNGQRNHSATLVNPLPPDEFIARKTAETALLPVFARLATPAASLAPELGRSAFRHRARASARSGPNRRRRGRIKAVDTPRERASFPLPRWGRSSAGRAPRSQCGGLGFDPPRLHQLFFLILLVRHSHDKRHRVHATTRARRGIELLVALIT